MRLLLDTDIAIWLFAGDAALAPHIRIDLEDTQNQLFFSAASIWEAEIKKASGRLAWPDDGLDRLGAAGIVLVDMLASDAICAARLPAHHGDPFDRMIIAQAQRLNLTLVTRDANMRKYDVRTLKA